MKRLALIVGLLALSACTPAEPGPSPSVSTPPSTSAPTATDIPTPTVTNTPVTTSAEPAPSTTESTPSPIPPPAPVDVKQVEITWYGSYDNDPKGSLAIDGPDVAPNAVIHQLAGGTGTWADPLTFASPTAPDGSPGAYAYGERIYVPSVQKYFIREDSCEVSWTAPNGCGATTHVDLYMGNPSGTKDVLKCEDALTPDGLAPIIVNPTSDLPVDPMPEWTEKTKACHVRK